MKENELVLSNEEIEFVDKMSKYIKSELRKIRDRGQKAVSANEIVDLFIQICWNDINPDEFVDEDGNVFIPFDLLEIDG